MLSGETCSACGTNNARCTDSRLTEMGRKRRRECIACGTRWSTIEVHEELLQTLMAVIGADKTLHVLIKAARKALQNA